MKRLFPLFLFTLLSIIAAAQQTVSRDADGNKVVKGIINRQEFSTDTAFAWFAASQKDYVPDQSALKALRENRDSITILAFGGTWCHDTRYILPKFFVLADAAGLSPDKITVVGVDHDKTSMGNLSKAFNITNVPTLIVLKKGKEIGRVLEYGEHGMFDRELGEIVSGKK